MINDKIEIIPATDQQKKIYYLGIFTGPKVLT